VITICATLYESLYKVGHTVSVKVGHVPLCLKYYSSVIFPILLCCGYWCTDLAAVMARTIKKVQANKSENQKRQKNPQQMKGPKRQAVNTWQEDRMFGAIEEFKRVGGQLRFIARAWGVPKSTLERRVKGKVIGHEHLLGKKTLLSKEQEAELEELLLEMARRGFPMMERDVRDVCYQYAKRNGITGFSEAKQKAGYYWMKGFLRRHPVVSVKSP